MITKTPSDNNVHGMDSALNDDEISKLGKPRLGNISKCTIKIKENKEFKVKPYIITHQ